MNGIYDNIKKPVCIVIPTHKTCPTNNETVALLQLKKVLPDYPKFLIIPCNLDASKYLELDDSYKLVRFKDTYFKSERAYNVLCRIPLFYKPFLLYKYMLIYQLDCFVFRNDLTDWCNKNFDYIAPPWFEGKWIKQKCESLRMPFLIKFLSRVGNGGLSLRNIRKFYKASFLTQLISTKIIFHEDVLWSNVVHLLYPGFKIADFNSALGFGFEEMPEKCLALNNGRLPFGCHAWEKYSPNFWQGIIRNLGYKIN